MATYTNRGKLIPQGKSEIELQHVFKIQTDEAEEKISSQNLSVPDLCLILKSQYFWENLS